MKNENKFSAGDRVVLVDISGGRLGYKAGMQATVIKHEHGRVLVIFDGDEEEISGSERRFRKLTKLDEALQ